MKLGVLFSGGKDSCLAMLKASKYYEIACLITILPRCKESYMFHIPNINLTSLQAKALGLPLIKAATSGEKEKELSQLKQAIQLAIKKFKISGVVSGAVASTYQASRIQKICNKLNIWCFNPLWQLNQYELLKELQKEKFEVIISGVFAYPFGKEWLGKKLDKKAINELLEINKNTPLNLAGEGGEYETFVLDCPLFKKKIKILNAILQYSNYAGVYRITKTKLISKK